jgi:hypothetical protein
MIPWLSIQIPSKQNFSSGGVTFMVTESSLTRQGQHHEAGVLPLNQQLTQAGVKAP